MRKKTKGSKDVENYIVLHGFSGNLAFKDYLDKEIKKLGGNPIFPTLAINPKNLFNEWRKALDEVYTQGLINEDSTVICHSISTACFVRWLTLMGLKIKTYISLAAFTHGVDSPLLSPENKKKYAIEETDAPTKEDRNNFRELVTNRISIFSDDDELFSRKNMEAYADDIDAAKIVVHYGHMKTLKEFPEVIAVLKGIQDQEER